MAAGIAFADWRSDVIARTEVASLGRAQPYEPGQFFKRELPHLLGLIDRFGEPPATIAIDGYVTLGADQRDGSARGSFRLCTGRFPSSCRKEPLRRDAG